jgi:hypothetical protein
MKQKQKETQDNRRQYWIWVTRPNYYRDVDGNERQDLNPSSEIDVGGWWTCHKNTQIGDLIFLWRTSPKRDIGYLIQAASDAYSIADDDYASQQGWDYGCDYQVLYRFANPVTMQDLHDAPYLHDWGAYRAHFQGRVFKIPPEHWERLNQLASRKNPDYQGFIGSVQRESIVRKILLEEQLEEALMRNLGLLKPFGYDLSLFLDPTTGATGRQFVCKGIGGRMDLFCYDTKARRYVIIELKNVRAGQNTFGQICTYIGWVQDRIAGSIPVVGLVISRGYDARFESSLKVTQQVFHLDIQQLGFS